MDNNPFFNDYLQGAVEKRMAGKGFERVAAGQKPDLLIHYHASVNQKLDVYKVDNQYGYCYGSCEPQVVDYELGTLVIDIVDAKTNKVVWRGWAQDAMNGIIDNQIASKSSGRRVTKMMRSAEGGAALR